MALARVNQKQAGAENVDILKGEIAHFPLPDNAVDVIISNCVINLSADKDQVFREAVPRTCNQNTGLLACAGDTVSWNKQGGRVTGPALLACRFVSRGGLAFPIVG